MISLMRRKRRSAVEQQAASTLAAICRRRGSGRGCGRRLLARQAFNTAGRGAESGEIAVLPPWGIAFEGAASRQAFALSPDGARLAFTAIDSSGAFSVFLRDFNSPWSPSVYP